MTLRKSARLAIGAMAACVLLYFFPLVRVRSLDSVRGTAANSHTMARLQAGAGQHTGPLDMETVVESLWAERLPEAIEKAATVDEVLAMAGKDASRARKRFGRQVGLGGPTFFFLRGRGQIESVGEDECQLIIDGQSQRVALQTGILASNAVRDATGLVNVGDFPNSQDFNRLSAELNRRCETEVIRPIGDRLVVGTIVDFVGCGEVRDDDGFMPLKLIPVRLRIVKAMESPE